MKIMTWNIQNGGIIDRYNPVFENIQKILYVIETETPDIIIIQEFQYEYAQFLIHGLKKLGYISFHYDKVLEEFTLRNGVLIASKFDCEPITKPQTILKYSWRNWNEILIPKTNLKITGIDVPLAETIDKYGNRKDNRREKKMFLEALNQKFIEYRQSDEPALILGDFNLHNEAVFKEYLKGFSSKLTEITNTEATHRNHKFDYIFANDRAVIRLQKDNYRPVWTKFSDHAYLFVNIC